MNTAKRSVIMMAGAALFALAFACWFIPRNNTISGQTAASLAAALANAKASADYGVAPFLPSDGQIEIKGDRWTWTAARGYGYTDLRASISCRMAQAEPSVEVSQTVNMQW